MTHPVGRCAPVILVFCVFVALCPSVRSQSAKPSPNGKPPLNPKCSFLRSEVRRIAQDGQTFVDNAQLANASTVDDLPTLGASLADWANYVAATELYAAQRTIRGLEVSACERNLRLADPGRLSVIETMRVAQVRRAVERWQSLAGAQGSDFESLIIEKVNSAYEAEARSFYSPAMSKFEDPDVGKDYPNLFSMVQNSALDQNTKEFYARALPILHYEEAGRLANTLSGEDKGQGLSYAYLLRNALSSRVDAEIAKQTQTAVDKASHLTERFMSYAIWGFICLVAMVLLWFISEPSRAKYRAFRHGLKRSPFWFGNIEWVFWDPGETVVLLRHKQLVPMKGRDGGYCTMSAWRGEEYRGRISYKTQFSQWQSDSIMTSDGLAVRLAVGIWWRIVDASLYVSRISSEYHEGDAHKAENLGEPAAVWIKTLAAGTLREEVNHLPAEKLISPYVQAYLQVRSATDKGEVGQDRPLPNFSEQLGKVHLGKVHSKLDGKTQEYGITIERFEVQELILPPQYQEKLERVRVAFLEPTEAQALTKAQVIALEGLGAVIGKDKVGLIEVLKHVDLSHINMNPFTGTVPVVQPVLDLLNRQSEKALPGSKVDRSVVCAF